MKTAILIALASICSIFADAMHFLTVDGAVSLDPFAIVTAVWCWFGCRGMTAFGDLAEMVNGFGPLVDD
jgi:hypothetical protein